MVTSHKNANGFGHFHDFLKLRTRKHFFVLFVLARMLIHLHEFLFVYALSMCTYIYSFLGTCNDTDRKYT